MFLLFFFFAWLWCFCTFYFCKCSHSNSLCIYFFLCVFLHACVWKNVHSTCINWKLKLTVVLPSTQSWILLQPILNWRFHVHPEAMTSFWELLAVFLCWSTTLAILVQAGVQNYSIIFDSPDWFQSPSKGNRLKIAPHRNLNKASPEQRQINMHVCFVPKLKKVLAGDKRGTEPRTKNNRTIDLRTAGLQGRRVFLFLDIILWTPMCTFCEVSVQLQVWTFVCHAVNNNFWCHDQQIQDFFVIVVVITHCVLLRDKPLFGSVEGFATLHCLITNHSWGSNVPIADFWLVICPRSWHACIGPISNTTPCGMCGKWTLSAHAAREFLHA